MVSYQDILNDAEYKLQELDGNIIDIINIGHPTSYEFALNIIKILSKLSPIVGNLLEFRVVDFLNENSIYAKFGQWIRQDPGFPDALFKSSIISPNPGIEIKAWYPLATEITGRFRESQKIFFQNEISVCILAWIPEYIIFGSPKIIGVCIVPAKDVALSRDMHYSNPPDYIVIEPEDTSLRPSNLQQTNTYGHKWQGNKSLQSWTDAKCLVENWGLGAYSYDESYQSYMRELLTKYQYRIDTNYAKIDRINNPAIENFKIDVLNKNINGMSIANLAKGLKNDRTAYSILKKIL